jgi:SAM-dependent methyltransferase
MSAQQDDARSYDEVPYESNPLHPTHPGNLALIAHLHGLAAAPLARCRVLEIGCATGGNLLPMAVGLPEARFVGVDLSPAQIATARRVQHELGLANVEFVVGSITEIGLAAGSFDYVVCHGVFSWVPAEVQEGILATCAHVLAPEGIAYVSYNTYPGWHLRGMVRDMLLHHLRDVVEPRQRIARAREFVQFLHTTARDRDSAFVRFLGEEAQLLAKATDTYVFHEHLEANNRPLWVRGFVDQARRHGLDFVAEAVLDDGWETGAEVAGAIDRLARDRIDREQYLDCLRNRTFRRSLLCRTGRAIEAAPRLDRLRSSWLASPMQPERAAADLRGDGVEAFVGPGGRRLQIGHPWLKHAFAQLGRRWPAAVTFPELAASVATALGAAPTADELDAITAALAQCHAGGVLSLACAPSLATGSPGARPLASPLARHMAASGRRVASLRHELVEVGDVDRLLLPLLDGTRDRAALALALRRAAAAAGVDLQRGPEVAVAESLSVLTIASLLLQPGDQPGAGVRGPA